MRSATACWILFLLLAPTGCTRNPDPVDIGDGELTSHEEKPDVDPMLFVIHYKNRIEDIIRQHRGDCEGALAELLRFVADQKRSFLEDTASTADSQRAIPEKSARFLMDFAESCPDQVQRLNQALHSVVRRAW